MCGRVRIALLATQGGRQENIRVQRFISAVRAERPEFVLSVRLIMSWFSTIIKVHTIAPRVPLFRRLRVAFSALLSSGKTVEYVLYLVIIVRVYINEHLHVYVAKESSFRTLDNCAP